MPFPTSTNRFSVLQWNARGLCHHKPKLQREKMAHLIDMAKHHSITFISEVHADSETMKWLMARFDPLFEWYFTAPKTMIPTIATPQEQTDAGGLLCLIQRSHFVGWSHSWCPIKGHCPRQSGICHFSEQQEMQCYLGST